MLGERDTACPGRVDITAAKPQSPTRIDCCLNHVQDIARALFLWPSRVQPTSGGRYRNAASGSRTVSGSRTDADADS
jgi:hypothetical protein